jgi:hypothetical protein
VEARAAVLFLLGSSCHGRSVKAEAHAAVLLPPDFFGRSAEAHVAVLLRCGWRGGGRAAWQRRFF